MSKPVMHGCAEALADEQGHQQALHYTSPHHTIGSQLLYYCPIPALPIHSWLDKQAARCNTHRNKVPCPAQPSTHMCCSDKDSHHHSRRGMSTPQLPISPCSKASRQSSLAATPAPELQSGRVSEPKAPAPAPGPEPQPHPPLLQLCPSTTLRPVNLRCCLLP